jgi:hypothetical protein
MLSIRNGGTDAQDKISWKWRSASPLGSLGNPLASDGFTLCLYDVSNSPAVLFRSVVPAGGLCGARPCWKAARNGTGFSFADRSAAHDGTRAFNAMSGTPRGSRVRYSGKGTGLSGRPFGLPGIPLPDYVYLTVEADGGACVGGFYMPAGVKVNDPVRATYRAKSELTSAYQ